MIKATFKPHYAETKIQGKTIDEVFENVKKALGNQKLIIQRTYLPDGSFFGDVLLWDAKARVPRKVGKVVFPQGFVEPDD